MLPNMVIKKLGDFSHIRSPAKCAARIGYVYPMFTTFYFLPLLKSTIPHYIYIANIRNRQAFSNSREIVTLDPEIVKVVSDVERNGRVFSDGVGTISTEFLDHMRQSLPFGYGNWATCFQVRYKGK